MSTAPPPSAPVVVGVDGSASSLTAVDLAAAQAAMIEASSRAQLVVVGTRGHGGFTGLLPGSVSQAVLHHAACPVAIVPPPRTGM